MKGYLQRLVTSASRPERRVQPFVSALFAEVPREESMEQVRRLVVQPVTARVIHEPAGQIVQTEIKRPLNEESDNKLSDASSSFPIQSSRYTPMISRLSAERHETHLSPERPEPDVRETSNARGTQSDTFSEHPLQIKNLDTSSALPEDQVNSPRRAVQPLLVQTQQVQEKNGLQNEIFRVQPAAVRRNAQESGVAAKAPARNTSEDIQIHIGRIEVIAVPQAAPRVVAEPASKSTSLGDYLKHRNGRAG